MGRSKKTTMLNPSSARSRRVFLQSLTAAGAGIAFRSNRSLAGETESASLGPVPKRKFGRHDETVSSLGLGGHSLARAKSVEEATRIAHAAIEAGITFMDNAWE
jgi:hypothetical protein